MGKMKKKEKKKDDVKPSVVNPKPEGENAGQQN